MNNPKFRQKTNFLLLLNGQIETAKVVYLRNLYCKYFYVYGSDWQQIAGLQEGLSSTCQKSAQKQHIVLNCPLEATFISNNPFKWPQLVICCYENDRFGNDVIKGYGATFLPSIPGRTIRKVPIFLPQASSSIQKIIGYFTGRRPEFVDPRIVATSDGRDITRVATQGIVTINMMIVLKDIKKLGYDVQAHTAEKFISEFPFPNFDEQRTKNTYLTEEMTQINNKNEKTQEDGQSHTTLKIHTIDEESPNEEIEKSTYD